MQATLPLEIYETFEARFGKDDARKLVKSFESVISDFTDYKWAVTRDELFSRLATKEEISRLEGTLASKEELALAVSRLVTKDEFYQVVSKLATKEEISKLATKEEISKLATKEEISRFATSLELQAAVAKLATREELQELREQVSQLQALMAALPERMTAHEERIENKLLRFDRRFTIMFVVLFLTVIFLNQNSLNFILQILGVIK